MVTRKTIMHYRFFLDKEIILISLERQFKFFLPLPKLSICVKKEPILNLSMNASIFIEMLFC